MAGGWKQNWQDVIASLRGRADSEPEAESASEEPGTHGSGITRPSLDGNAGADRETTRGTPGDSARPAPETRPSRGSGIRRWRMGGLVGAIGIVAVMVWYYASGDQVADNPPAPDVVATYDGGRITLDDIAEHMRMMSSEDADVLMRSPNAIVGVVEDLISDRIVLRWAAERKPQGDESFRHAAKHIDEELSLAALSDQIHEEQLTVSESDLRAYYDANRAALAGQTFEEAREGISRTLKARREPDYVASYVERLRSNASITRNYDLLRVPSPTDDELRRYYDENRDSFKLTRRVIVDELAFPIGSFGDAARQKAADALLRIRGGATFSEASADKEGTRMASGREVAEGTEAPEWETAVFALVPGELASVFQAEDAFYVVRLVDSRPARSRELSEVRAEVAEAVARRKEEAWFAANGDKTLFTIKSERYNLGQFYDEFRELPRGLRLEYSAPDGMKRLADDLIDRMLLVSDTYDQLLDVKTRPQADESRLRLMAQMMEQEEVDDQVVVSDADIQDYYSRNSDLIAYPPKARVRYVRIGLGSTADEKARARERADEAYAKLVPGFLGKAEEFAIVARDYSEDSDSAGTGGELSSWVGEGADPLSEMFDHPFHQAVMALDPGEIGKPFELGDSLYIVEVLERTEAQPVSLEEARPYIEDLLRERRHDELAASLQARLLDEAAVTVYPSVLDSYLGMQPRSADR